VTFSLPLSQGRRGKLKGIDVGDQYKCSSRGVAFGCGCFITAIQGAITKSKTYVYRIHKKPAGRRVIIFYYKKR
jgi:hypothetical protein